MLFAREGADVAIGYLPAERSDALETKREVESHDQRCLLVEGDLTDASFCDETVERTMEEFGKLDILVSNAAHQNRKRSLEDVTDEEFDRTFKTNVYAYFRLARAALRHMKPGASIIVTSSVTGILGSKSLPDYSATKGAINALHQDARAGSGRARHSGECGCAGPGMDALNAADSGASPEKVAEFGSHVPMGRPAQPEELAPAYVFLASNADSSYITGTVLQVMGGETAGG